MREYYVSCFRKYWLVLVLVGVAWFVPSVFVVLGGAAWAVTRTVVGTGANIATSAYGTGSEVVTGESGPVQYTGPEHLVNMGVSFQVNQNYHRWGQLFRSYHQLPEISGRIYAAKIVGGRVVSTLADGTSLIAQRRVNWSSELTMTWTDLRVRAPEFHLPIGARTGWYVCVDLGEVSEGHNFLGPIDDAAHAIHWGDWHMTAGDQMVAGGECVPLNNNSFPDEGTLIKLKREGENVPMGQFRIDFRGVYRAVDLLTPPKSEWSTGAF